ncbi:MAG: hypothetical protein AMK73_06210 [Planctomycetes bacterium SM23_32]|nr:MAG: hypothetical protein AMK73_06210 [Planctomycetes bacterium SM23_32]
MVELAPERLGIMRAGGVWVPSPLALDEDRRMVEERQRLLTLYYFRAGARTVVPGAHTGEFAGGDLDLYDRWLRLVAEVTATYGGPDVFLMSAVGGRQVMNQAEAAARHGFDVAMVAPTAFSGLDDDGVVALFRDVASVIPTFGFELQRAVPGSREFSSDLWRRLFEIIYGAKGASFDTYRAQNMLEAAARSARRADLVLASGNDDRIVADLGGRFPFNVDGNEVVASYAAGLLGHFATDTHAAVQWSEAVRASRDGAQWRLPVGEKELAHLVNMCNGALFDALGNFENSVWGVKCRLTQLGLLEAPHCFRESGRAGLDEAIARAYAAHAVLNDDAWLAENLDELKREAGVA